MAQRSARSKRMDQLYISQEEFESKEGLADKAKGLVDHYSAKGIDASIMFDLKDNYGPRLARRVEASALRRRMSVYKLLKAMSKKAEECVKKGPC